MRLERRSLSRLALPLKALVDRFAFGALVLLSIALLVVGKANVQLLEGIGTRIGDALVPALGAMMQPISSSRRLVEQVGELVALRAENARLREQNLRLLEWQSAARQLSVENAALRQLLSMPADPELPTAVTGRVVADAGWPVRAHGAPRRRDRARRRPGHGCGQRTRLGRAGDRGRSPELARAAADRLQLAHSGDGRAVARSGDPRGQQHRPAGSGFSAAQPAPRGRRCRGHLGPGRRAAAGLEIGTVRSIDDAGVTVEPLVDFARLEYLRLLEYTHVVPPEQLEELQQEIYGPPLPPGFTPTEAPPSTGPSWAGG